jgi:hypothetical protein
MLKVGDLVRYDADGDIGIVILVNIEVTGDYKVQWSDGCYDWHLESELEVL